MGRVHADGAQATPGAPPRKLRRALGVALEGESVEELDRLGVEDQLRAEQGLVPVIGKGGQIFYKHIDDLSTYDMDFRTSAERLEEVWLRERVERKRRALMALPFPTS